MKATKKCPECGCSHIGQGKWDGYALLSPVDRFFTTGSKVLAEVCTNCGLILALRVAKPEKFKKKEK